MKLSFFSWIYHVWAARLLFLAPSGGDGIYWSEVIRVIVSLIVAFFAVFGFYSAMQCLKELAEKWLPRPTLDSSERGKEKRNEKDEGADTTRKERTEDGGENP